MTSIGGLCGYDPRFDKTYAVIFADRGVINTSNGQSTFGDDATKMNISPFSDYMFTQAGTGNGWCKTILDDVKQNPADEGLMDFWKTSPHGDFIRLYNHLAFLSPDIADDAFPAKFYQELKSGKSRTIKQLNKLLDDCFDDSGGLSMLYATRQGGPVSLYFISDDGLVKQQLYYTFNPRSIVMGQEIKEVIAKEQINIVENRLVASLPEVMYIGFEALRLVNWHDVGSTGLDMAVLTEDGAHSFRPSMDMIMKTPNEETVVKVLAYADNIIKTEVNK